MENDNGIRDDRAENRKEPGSPNDLGGQSGPSSLNFPPRNDCV